MPSESEMLEALVAANRERYEREGHVVSNTEAFDREFRTRKLRDDENRPGAIRIAWENLTGNAPRRTTDAQPAAMTQLEYTGGLAATLLADGDWTDAQITEMLMEADDISRELAHRILDESRTEAAAEVARRAQRREARERETAGLKPSVPHLERLITTRVIDSKPITIPELPAHLADDIDDEDLSDDNLWNHPA